MKIFKWIKRTLVMASLFVGLVLLGYWGAIHWMDFNRFKPQLKKLAAERGVYLEMKETDIKADAFPLTLMVSHVAGRLDGRYLTTTVQNSRFNIQEVKIALSLWALFVEQKIRITHLQIQQPQWTLTLAKGKMALALQQLNAYEPLVVNLTQSPQIAQWHFSTVSLKNGASSQTVSSPSAVEWRLKSLFVDQGKVQLQTAEQKPIETLEQLQLMAFDLQAQEPFPLNAQFQFKRWLPKEPSPMTGKVTLNAQGQYLSQSQLWQLQKLQGKVDLRLPQELHVPPLNAQLAIQQLQYQAQKGQLQLSGLSLKGLGSEVVLDFTADLKQQQWQGYTVLSDVNLKSWARHLNGSLPNFTHQKALTHLSGQFSWQWHPQGWQLTDLALNWDGAHIKGRIWQQQRSLNDPMEMNFTLNIDQLNLDYYQAKREVPSSKAKLSENAQNPSPAVQKSVETVYLPFAVPVSTLRALKAEGHLQVGTLIIQGVHLKQLETTFQADHGQLAFAPFDFNPYGGLWRSKLRLNVNGQTPAYEMEGRFEQVNLQRLWQDIEVKPLLNGQGSGRFRLYTHGSNREAWLGHMNGNLQLVVNQGQLVGGNLNQLLYADKKNRQPITRFQKLNLKGVVREGVYYIGQIDLTASQYKALGVGQVNLVSQAINMSLKARLLKPKDQDLVQAVVPFKIVGTLQKPIWQVEVKKLLNSPENRQAILQKLGQFLQRK
ncbi:AsmA family protein [Galenea microaerophila]